MGLFEWLDPVDEENAIKDAQANIANENKLKTFVTPQASDNIAKIYRQSPWMSAPVILALAKGNASQATIDAASSIGMRQYIADANPAKPKKESWFQRNVSNKAKTLSRWAFAGLNLTPELAQNLGSQIFSGNDPAGVDGWFASTSLGQMAGGKDSGSGFFIGGEAAKTQAEKAREFRGTINNHAWTIGRGAADLVFTPGSREYSLLSGFLDGAVNLYADPTMIAGQALKVARTGEAARGLIGTRGISQKIGEAIAETGIIGSDVIPKVGGEWVETARRLARGEAGLEAAETIGFFNTKFGQWVTSNSKAVRYATHNADRAAEISRQVADGTIDVTVAAQKRGFLAFKLIEEFGGKIDETTALRMAEADTVLKQQGILGEAAARLEGNVSSTLLPKQIGEVATTGATYAVRQAARERVPLYRNIRNSRWFATMPKGAVIMNGSGLDRAKSILNYSNYLRGIKLDKELPQEYERFMGSVVNAFAVADPAAQKIAVEELFDDAIGLIFEQAGGKNVKAFADQIVKQARQKMAEARTFNINELGSLDDGGLVRALADYIPEDQLRRLNPEQLRQAVLSGPGSLVELQDFVHVLPDFRSMRALTANPMIRRAVLNKKGNQRSALAITEFVQNEIWKPMALATGGYVMRNMIDAQTRIAMSGLKGFFNHPFQYIQMAMGDRAIGGITANELGNPQLWNGKLTELIGSHDARMADLQEALTFGTYVGMDDPVRELEKQLRNGNFSIADEGDAVAHTTGYVDNLGQIAADPVLRQVATLNALSPEERGTQILRWFQTPEGQKEANRVIRYFRNGVKITDPVSKKYEIIKFTNVPEDEILDIWVRRLSENKINTIVRGDNDLQFVIAHNRVPLFTRVRNADGTLSGERVRAATVERAEDSLNATERAVGEIVRDGENENIVVAFRDSTPADVDPFTGVQQQGRIAILQPVEVGDAFQGDLGSDELRGLLDRKREANLLAKQVKVAQRGIPANPDVRKRALDSWRASTDWFFNRLYGQATQKLERSVVYRQYFYKEVEGNLDLLSRSEAQTLLDNVTRFATNLETTPELYVGDKKIWRAIQDAAASGDVNATGTVQQLEQYASAVALNQTKELLYNATERNNLEDILRVVVPFAGAWKEVMGTYFDFLVEDPTRIRRAQLAFTGATNFDPDNNGEGFFYKDPTTGEYNFNFPGSGWLAEHLTGVNAPLQAPVKRLSIGLGIIPGVGPVGQLAASQIIPDTPQFDEISKIIMPYGRKEGFPIAPTWLTRAKDAIEGNTVNMETVFANTYVETLRALTVSGEYDLANPEEKEKLYADARNKARILAGMRVLGQFIGPTSPTAEFKVTSKQGDIYGTTLVKEFYKLQAENYDTAVTRFLETFGDDALLYISSKTESTVGGLEPTEAFGDWERGNEQLFKMYPDVAGFMAPGGADFDFQVWNRQVTTGKRRRLTDRELVAQAEYKVGAAKYRELKSQLGESPSEEQRDWLRSWKEELYKQYPGFLQNSKFDPNALPRKIEQMRAMVSDPALSDNDTAQALAKYLGYRDQAIQQAELAGYKSLASNAAQPLRDWLSSIAVALVKETPEFARIFERELSYEVDQ